MALRKQSTGVYGIQICARLEYTDYRVPLPEICLSLLKIYLLLNLATKSKAPCVFNKQPKIDDNKSKSTAIRLTSFTASQRTYQHATRNTPDSNFP